MILTIALNPGIEKYIGIHAYEEGTTIPVNQYDLRIAGSSIHSSYVMKMLQADPYVLGFAGGIGGRYIKNFLDKSRIKSNLITKDKELRTIMFITNGEGIVTQLVDDEEAFTDADERNLKHRLVSHVDEAELMLVNGNIAHEGSRNMIQQSMALAAENNKRVVLAIDGVEIMPYIEQSPFGLVLSPAQVDLLTGEGESLEQRLEILRQLVIKHHIHYLFYLWEDKVMGVTKNKIAYGTVPGRVYEDLPWRKDAMAGGLTIGIKRKYEFEKILKLTCGVCYSITEKAYPILCTRKDLDLNTNKTRVTACFSGGAYTMGES